MAFPLSVSSFPDTVLPPTRHSMGLEVVVTPVQTKRRRQCMKHLFAMQRPSPELEAEVTEEHNQLRTLDPKGSIDQSHIFPTLPQSPSMISQAQETLVIFVPMSHNSDRRSMSFHASSGKYLPWTDGAAYNHHPRSTKESIAGLGLLRHSPTPDVIADTDSMVADCCTNGWVEPPALPPLPPLPPPKEPKTISAVEASHRRTSSLVSDLPHSQEIFISNSYLDDSDSESSVPPSPITFSRRPSSYIAVGSTVDPTSNTSIDIMSSPIFRPQNRSCTSKPTPPRRREPSPPSIPAPMMVHPWMSVVPSGYFAPRPKLRPKAPKILPTVPQPSLSSLPSPLSPSRGLSIRRVGWKPKFLRIQRSSENVRQPTPQPREPRRSSVHIPPGASVDSFASSTSQSSDGSRTIRARTPTPMRFFRVYNEANTAMLDHGVLQPKAEELTRMTTHHAVGDIWKETDIGEAISSLRRLKVSGKYK